MFCCCFPLYLPVPTPLVTLCALLQFAAVLWSVLVDVDVSLGLVCAGILLTVSSSKNYNSCGLYVLLGAVDSVSMVSAGWRSSCVVLWVRVLLHLVSMCSAKWTYTALKCAHSVQVHSVKSLRVPLLY